MSLTIEPTGVSAVHRETLVDMVAQSATFQQRVGVASAEAARDHIYRNELMSYDRTTKRPYAIVYQAAGTRWDLNVGGSQNFVSRVTGSLYLYLTDASQETETDDALVDFENYAEGVVLDVVNLAGADRGPVKDSYLPLTSVRTDYPATGTRADEQNSDDYFAAIYELFFE